MLDHHLSLIVNLNYLSCKDVINLSKSSKHIINHKNKRYQLIQNLINHLTKLNNDIIIKKKEILARNKDYYIIEAEYIYPKPYQSDESDESDYFDRDEDIFFNDERFAWEEITALTIEEMKLRDKDIILRL